MDLCSVTRESAWGGSSALGEYLHINLGKTINGRASLLHSPSLCSTVLSSSNILRNRPDGSRLTHVETTHRFLIGGELISIENTSTSYKTRVSVFLKPLGSESSTLTSTNTLLGALRLGNCLHFLVLSGLVVRGGSESNGLPNGVHAGRAEVGLTDDGKVDSESREAQKGLALGSLLRGLVHFVTKAICVKGILKTDFGDALRANPGIIEAVGSSLKETEILHLDVIRSHRSTSGAAHALLAKRTKG
mmetsp:Transcript_35321/g.59968  ORF Transcript_35321/g.59968 Transcript_35321/m.59968 type:complete len:247 (-) Transcript_35321:159-899(-)